MVFFIRSSPSDRPSTDVRCSFGNLITGAWLTCENVYNPAKMNASATRWFHPPELYRGFGNYPAVPVNS
jgi:hypothetical protein